MDAGAVDLAIDTLREGLPGAPFLFIGLIGPHWIYCPQEDFFLSYYGDARYSASEEVEGAAAVTQDDFLCYSDFPAKLRPYVEEPESADGCFTGSRIHEAAYDSEISVTDREIGRFFEELKAAGMFDKSLIIVTADHGENMADHPMYFSHGEEPYNSKILVPLIVKLPYQYTGSVVGDYVRTMDIMPTVFEALDLAPPGGIDARSLMPYIEGEDVSYDERPAISLLRRYDGSEVVSIIVDDFKFMRRPLKKSLYDLRKDPGEQTDVAVENPETVEALEELLYRYYPSAP
jgi:arylsulfatase A-like enzyme